MIGNSEHQSKRRRLEGDDTFIAQSLPVGELPGDGQPLDGEQYLALVRNQAMLAPNVFKASHNPYALPISGTLIESKQSEAPMMPSEAWRQQFILHYRNMREALNNPPTEYFHFQPDRLPKPSNAVGWYIWIHGRAPPDEHQQPGSRNQRSSNGVWKIKEPSGIQLQRLSTEHILGLLEAFPYWLVHRLKIPDDTVKQDASPVIAPLHSRWLFALLARLDSRLVSEQISILRTLARACIAAISLARIRRRALQSRSQITAPLLPDMHDEAGAWFVVTIVTSIWGQADLWADAIADLRR